MHVDGFPDGITPVWRNGFTAVVEWPPHLKSKVEVSLIPQDSIIYRVIMFYNPKSTQLGGL